MYYYITIGATLIFSGLAILFKNKIQKSAFPFAKVSAIIFSCVFFARYFFYLDYPIDNIIGLQSGDCGKALTALSLICVWFSSAAFLTLVLSAFFQDVACTKPIIKYFCLPTYLASIILTNFNIVFLMGSQYLQSIRFTAVMYAIENAFGFSLCLLKWLTCTKNEAGEQPSGNEKKGLAIVKSFINGGYKTLIALFAMLLCTFPSYGFQVLLGKGPALWIVDDFSVIHRIFLYFAFIIPLCIYFSLREKSYSERLFAMIFLSLALMLTYCSRFKYTSFLKPWVWPLHLCNTAMFIIPLCLIFKMKRLFYFTYFINVMGAFLAMIMPTYGESNITSWELVNFWVNHYPAFFMPLLLVALKIFDRPKIKQFYHSMATFFVYFVLVLVLNPLFTAMGHSVDFFFLNSDFIPSKLGKWAENIFAISATLNIGDIKLVFYPLYQLLFFLVYVGIAFGIWFVYAQMFALADGHYDMMTRKRKIRQDKLALAATLKGRSIEQPMNTDAGIKLQLDHFSKKYATSKTYAVKDACLTVNGGEIFGFLGPNGAGKSTIIKSIVGIQPITDGNIEICGFDCTKQPRQAKSIVGFVPDHYALYEKLTGREYINYIADIYDVSKAEREERISRMVSLFELEGSFDCSMKTYSHGMKQKITIMAALVHNPKLWILDEPLTGLDPNSIFQVKECMRHHAEEGNMVFFSSHIIDVVERICDRIAIIKKGRILCVKSIKEIEEICPLEEFYMKMINDDDFAAKITGAKTSDCVGAEA